MKRADNPVRVFFLLLVLGLIVWLIFNMGNQLSSIKLDSKQFEKVVEENNISLIEIRQNSQTPTGEAIIYYTLTLNRNSENPRYIILYRM